MGIIRTTVKIQYLSCLRQSCNISTGTFLANTLKEICSARIHYESIIRKVNAHELEKICHPVADCKPNPKRLLRLCSNRLDRLDTAIKAQDIRLEHY